MINGDLQILRNIVNNDLLKFMVNNINDEDVLKEIIFDDKTEVLKCDYVKANVVLRNDSKVIDCTFNSLFSCHDPKLVDTREDNVYNKPKWFENNDYDIIIK